MTGDILYTWILTYPRMILSEFNTHRTFSRNTSSSRAIPSGKQRQRVLDDPFVPVYIGANQRGMQAGEELTGRREAAVGIWKVARLPQVLAAFVLERPGVHKQIANRLVEPWTWTQQIALPRTLKTSSGCAITTWPNPTLLNWQARCTLR